MIKFNILSSCLLTLCLSVNVSYAAPEGGVVTDGPLTYFFHCIKSASICVILHHFLPSKTPKPCLQA